ncbi:MAG: ROK family protein [Acidimicrobiia bacterium]|nr:ROK family protein [Acidimicrobiia bacterium]MBP8179815.1 ROK family protein [Acidimicrobiia bacterium]
MRAVLALDIGGTKVDLGLVGSGGQVLHRHRIPTPKTTDGAELWAEILAAVSVVLAEAETAPVACGIGCGGPMDPNGETVSPLNIPGWRRFPLRQVAASALDMPVWIDNDAKALALAEGWRGAGQGVDNFIAMVVSTGVGGGIVVDGRLLDGALGNAGHIGHVNVVPDGRRCACGAYGCLEAEASGTAIAAVTGSAPQYADEAVRRRCGTLVGRAVADAVSLLDIGLAVVAGSVALGFGRPFFAAAQQELNDRAQLSFARGARIEPARLGPDAPLIGAAAVAWRALGSVTVLSGDL